VGWGYSLNNTDPSSWFVTTNLNSDSFSNGTPTSLFDFPILAPGDTVTEPFDSVNSTGLFELLWDLSAPVGFANSGNFVLSGQWWDGDPLNGGNFFADAPDLSLAYTATVTGSVSAPEPSSFLLLAGGIAAIIGWRKVRTRSLAPIAVLILTVVLSSSVMAQPGLPPSEDTKDSGITRQQADEILKELKAIRQLLERQTQPAGPGRLPPMPQIPQTGKLRLEGGYSLGSVDAPVTIVEFTDYQCPFCRRFESTTFAEIRKKYIETGKVRLVIRDLPLVDMHPDAMQTAEAAHCAGDQEKFWPMHDALLSDTSKLGNDGLIDSAESIKLDMTVFRSCLESGKHKLEIQNDMRVASSLQVNGTPAFVIGKSTGEELSGAIIIGAQPFSVFDAAFREAATLH
jgi:protein-disulfide isomerase